MTGEELYAVHHAACPTCHAAVHEKCLPVRGRYASGSPPLVRPHARRVALARDNKKAEARNGK